MKELKLTIYKKDDDGATAIYHMQWDKDHDSDTKKELYDKLVNLVRETNVTMKEKKDHLKELRK